MTDEALKEPKMWYVYMIRIKNNNLYTGITIDTERRLSEHKDSKIGSKYLRGKKGIEIVFSQAVGDKSLASRVEWYLKKLSKKKKEAIVKANHLCVDTLLPVK